MHGSRSGGGGWGQVEEDNDNADNNDEYDDNDEEDNNDNDNFFLFVAERSKAKDAERSEANPCGAASFAKPR